MGILWGYKTYIQKDPKTLRISPYMYERKIREALEISKLRAINEKGNTFTVLNRDNGD